ncbi:MAG: MBL fold metallo-hydrolase [Desulfobacteraceae bacterium]|nr:MAG: MBL fold metallo-hydrolase [Desulfobacteraceae bacterium]
MVFFQKGLITNEFGLAGLSWTPVYVVLGKQPVLFEAGFACAGKLYAEDILNFSGDRAPRYLFLTHMHYDHCGASAFLKNRFPGLKIAASALAAEFMGRATIVNRITALSRDLIALTAAIPGVDEAKLLQDSFEPFKVDLLLKDGDRIAIEEGLTVEVMASPGHTRDMLSYYIPEKKILIATEASGCIDRAGTLIPEFLFDYEAYLTSLKRLAGLDVEILCQGHHRVFVGREEVRAFFTRSLQETARFKERVYELLDATKGNIEEVIRLIKQEQYDINLNVKQPEKAYLLNLTARVRHLAERYHAANVKGET